MKRFVAILMLVTVTGVPVFADTPQPLKVKRDTRLRLYLADGGRLIEGRLKDADDRSITVDTGSGRSERFSRDQLRSVMYRTSDRDRGKGGRIGGIITGVAGLVTCFAAWEREADRTLGPDRGNGQGAGLVCGLAGLVSALPGYGIGFAIGAPSGEWHGVAPAGFTVAGAVPPRRATASLTVRFSR